MNDNNIIHLFSTLPPDLQKKIRLIQLQNTLEARQYKKVSGCCGHTNTAQCLAYWDQHFSKINGAYYCVIMHWAGVELKPTRHNITVNDLSTRCVTLFQFP